MSKFFMEMPRVQLPAILHLTKLGYRYYGKIALDKGGEFDSDAEYDRDTNILLQVFRRCFARLNPGKEQECRECLRQIHNLLDDDDLGEGFYKMLSSGTPYRLLDFENIDNNEFHVTGEFACKNGEEDFRPDITLFVNGLPLCFVEVKQKNNKEGMLAELERMNDKRLPNRKFRRFLNITQLMIFSNNMEYDTLGGLKPVQGVFYGTTDRKKMFFNCFREDKTAQEKIAYFNLNYPYVKIDVEVLKKVLLDFNCSGLQNTQEFITNMDINTPTNRVLTSLCCPERLLFLLHYGIVYYHHEKERDDGIIETIDQKQIMRYPQLLASLAILRQLQEGKKSGIIWHTQGSGKTALSFYLHHILKDYYARQNIVTQFFFVVDRLDLMEQATLEFVARGMKVYTPDSREELMKQFQTVVSTSENKSGDPEIVVVNIQRFKDDKEKFSVPDYATNLQRIIVVDEAHRGYKPEGSFLGNLLNADKQAMRIALTGTPLLKEERQTWMIFGDYYHCYYYDKSVEDGYTLRIMREDIEKGYKLELQRIVGELEQLVKEKSLNKAKIYENDKYVDAFLHYVISDFRKFRMLHGDRTLGAMIVATSGLQAKKIAEHFQKIQAELDQQDLFAAQDHLHECLILFNEPPEKETRKQKIKNFKDNKGIDVLVVDDMLQTGFDAHRLKKLYLGKKLKDHTLLQALTRVNRPYRDQRYGYVVDFADIQENFDTTNAKYLQELQRFNNPEETGLQVPELNVLVTPEEIKQALSQAKEVLFSFPKGNKEEFDRALETMTKEKLLSIRRALNDVKDLHNIVRSYGDKTAWKLFQEFGEMQNLSDYLAMLTKRIDLLNFEEKLKEADGNDFMVNEALQYVNFYFTRRGVAEMDFVSGDERENLERKLRKMINIMGENGDQDDPLYTTLREEFRRVFSALEFQEITDLETFKQRQMEVDEVYHKLVALDNGNRILMEHYNGDRKFMRIHKRIAEWNKENTKKTLISDKEYKIAEYLNLVKELVDEAVYDRGDLLDNDSYLRQEIMVSVSQCAKELAVKLDSQNRNFLADSILQQYKEQLAGQYAA